MIVELVCLNILAYHHSYVFITVKPSLSLHLIDGIHGTFVVVC